jgi:Icc-related predicted phosphoesterase
VATKPTSPQDTTGRAAEEAAKRNAAELAARKEEISISRAQEAELLETAVFDPKKPDAPILIDEIEEVGISVKNDKVVIRTHHDIEDMTFGVINGTPQNYTFKAGVKYSVPRDLALYLQGLGYLWIA